VFLEKIIKVSIKFKVAVGRLKFLSTFAAQNSSAGVAQLARAADL
jgi:hypothetical protein